MTSRLNCKPPRLHFESLKLLNSDFNVDPDPTFHFNADPDLDPASLNNSDQCGTGSATLILPKIF